MNINTISALTGAALLALAGAATANNGGPSGIDDWTVVGTQNPVTPTNVSSSGGVFKYQEKNDKVRLRYKSKEGKANASIDLNDIDASGQSSPGSILNIAGGQVEVKNGVITITGVDPFSGVTGTLVTADYDENSLSAANFDFGAHPEGFDLFGVSTTNIDCPMWDFCTLNESFYVAGDFGGTFASKIEANHSYAVTTVPLPAAAWLFGSAMVGLVGLARRKRAVA